LKASLGYIAKSCFENPKTKPKIGEVKDRPKVHIAKNVEGSIFPYGNKDNFNSVHSFELPA
jgi:hypothetical protein